LNHPPYGGVFFTKRGGNLEAKVAPPPGVCGAPDKMWGQPFNKKKGPRKKLQEQERRYPHGNKTTVRVHRVHKTSPSKPAPWNQQKKKKKKWAKGGGEVKPLVFKTVGTFGKTNGGGNGKHQSLPPLTKKKKRKLGCG